MGSKLARRNKALKKMQPPHVASSPKGEEPLFKGIDDDSQSGVYRLQSAEGHFVCLNAQGKSHAHTRWTEFYPKAQVATCEYVGN